MRNFSWDFRFYNDQTRRGVNLSLSFAFLVSDDLVKTWVLKHSPRQTLIKRRELFIMNICFSPSLSASAINNNFQLVSHFNDCIYINYCFHLCEWNNNFLCANLHLMHYCVDVFNVSMTHLKFYCITLHRIELCTFLIFLLARYHFFHVYECLEYK